MYSRFYDRMFNGDFAEAKKAETDLASESADPKLFHVKIQKFTLI